MRQKQVPAMTRPSRRWKVRVDHLAALPPHQVKLQYIRHLHWHTWPPLDRHQQQTVVSQSHSYPQHQDTRPKGHDVAASQDHAGKCRCKQYLRSVETITKS